MTSSNPGSFRAGEGSMPESGGGTTRQKVKEDAREVKREVGARVRDQAEAGQHRLADEADALSDAIDAAAANLDDHDRDGLARYARELSSSLASAAGRLEGRSVDQLANDAKILARDNPALFMLGSIGVGFGLSRFFKASADRDHDQDNNDGRPSMTDRDDRNNPGQADQPLGASNPASTGPGNGDGRNLL